MRIGILTLPIGHNYGGILQNYALQQTLRRVGHHPVTLFDASPPNQSPCWKIFIHNLLVPLSHLFPLLTRREYLSYRKGEPYRSKVEEFVTWNFIKNNIHITDKNFRLTEKHIKDLELDAIIVGSDQVWRPLYCAGIEKMFCSFLSEKNPIKRIAYAASFGLDYWTFNEPQTERCGYLLRLFDAVSVREESAVGLCETFFGKKAEWVLDPTLLLSKDDYCMLCKDIVNPKEKYIAAYILDETEERKRLVYAASKLLSLPVKFFTADKGLLYSVPQWLSFFRDAEIVITDSFHGTVFSLIFNRDFLTFSNENRGNTRMCSLLKYFDLENRLCNEIEKNLNSGINWSIVNRKIQTSQEQSVRFLQQALS